MARVMMAPMAVGTGDDPADSSLALSASLLQRAAAADLHPILRAVSYGPYCANSTRPLALRQMDRLLRVQQHLVGSDAPTSPANPTAGLGKWLSNLFGASKPPNTESDGAEKDTHEEFIMIPTRDEGVRLSCLLCRPAGGEQPVPVLLTMHYGGDHPNPAGTMQPLARQGFAVADVVFRGCFRSEGMADGGIYVTLANDGYDVCEWLAAQDWCTGQVGTFGGSQAGFAQNLLASTAPPSLVCQYQQDTGLSLFHEAYRHGGGGQRGSRAFGGVPTKHRGLGNKDGETMSAWADHPHYDEYWAQMDATPQITTNNTPCCIIGSWHDFMCQGSIATYVGKQHLGAEGSRGKQTLICGPWLHGGGGRIDNNSSGASSSFKIGELDFPPQAAFPYPGGMREHMAQYFRQQMGLLSQEEKATVPEAVAPATVQYYVMGAIGEDFPIPATPTKYYLGTGGALGLDASQAQGSTDIVADPEHQADNGTGSVGFPGARDARPFEAQQPYVQTFTTPVLADPVEWTGAVHAAMHVQVGARDCDLIVRISDVYPDGRSMLIADYHRRASFRHGLNLPPSLLEPGDVCLLEFRVGWLSQIFAPGHSIRVTVSCTGLPLYETGGNGTDEEAGRTVHTLLHNGPHLSHVVAPVVGEADRVDMSEGMLADLGRGVFPA